MFHCRIKTGSPNASLKLYTSELGMDASLHDWIQDANASFLEHTNDESQLASL